MTAPKTLGDLVDDIRKRAAIEDGPAGPTIDDVCRSLSVCASEAAKMQDHGMAKAIFAQICKLRTIESRSGR